MVKYKLSFCSINILNDYIAEVIVNKNIEISLEMVEEYETFLADKFTNAFGLLINKINYFNFTFEAKLSIASHANLKAIAVVNYTKESELITKELATLRAIDEWNLKSFSGLDLGWQQAFDWLEKELSAFS
jgi:hypothetical protein